MNRIASNPAYPPRRPSPGLGGLPRPAPWIWLSPFSIPAIVTAISPKRDRDFTKSVTV